MSDRHLVHEARAFSEYWSLHGDPVWRGADVPPGDGRTVLVLPGLFGNDFYLRPLRHWLRRVGYRPALSMVGVNAGCPNEVRRRVRRTLPGQVADQDEPVAIIGHSRGGMLGKALATELGARCSHFIALGSPVGAVMRAGMTGLAAMARGEADDQAMAAPPVVEAGRAAMRLLSPHCDLPFCECSYVEALLGPLASSTRVFAVQATDDPVVDPEACVIDGAENVRIAGTHTGMVVNPAVYRHLGRMLAVR